MNRFLPNRCAIGAIVLVSSFTACKDSDNNDDVIINIRDFGIEYDAMTGSDSSVNPDADRDSGSVPDTAMQDTDGVDSADSGPIDIMSTIDTSHWDVAQQGDGGFTDLAAFDIRREDLTHYDLGPKDEGPRPDYGGCEPGGCNPCGYGSVVGMTCGPNTGSIAAIPYVHVWIETTDCDGNPVLIDDYSDSSGYYRLDNVPCGTHTIYMQKGNFSHNFTRWIDKCDTTDLTSNDLCFPNSPARIAVVTGKWDVIEKTLINLWFNHKQFDGLMDGPDSPLPEGGKLLSGQKARTNTGIKDLTLLDDFDILFINCGDSPDYIVEDVGSQVFETLRAFVAKGGSVYFSDYAAVYMNGAWPDIWSGTMPRDFPGSASSTPRMVTAELPDKGLAEYMQKETAVVEYRLGPLTSMVGTAPAGTTVHVRGPNSAHANAVEPFMISAKPEGESGGRVVFTNFHNEEQLSTGDMMWVLQYVVFLM